MHARTRSWPPLRERFCRRRLDWRERVNTCARRPSHRGVCARPHNAHAGRTIPAAAGMPLFVWPDRLRLFVHSELRTGPLRADSSGHLPCTARPGHLLGSFRRIARGRRFPAQGRVRLCVWDDRVRVLLQGRIWRRPMREDAHGRVRVRLWKRRLLGSFSPGSRGVRSIPAPRRVHRRLRQGGLWVSMRERLWGGQMRLLGPTGVLSSVRPGAV